MKDPVDRYSLDIKKIEQRSLFNKHLETSSLGKKYDRLTIEKYLGVYRRKTVWSCICDCGTRVNRTKTSLSSKRYSSCGCFERELHSAKRLNLEWVVCGELTVLNEVSVGLWKCQCTCGNVVNKSFDTLRSGNRSNCGCLRKKLRGSGVKTVGKLNVQDAIRVERVRNAYTWIFKCKNKSCDNTIKIRADSHQSTGFCLSCATRKRPFEALYNSHVKKDKRFKNMLTYDEYLEFTANKTCHYCDDYIPWNPYPKSINNTGPTSSYYLDRKNCKIGYSKNNCVVCCTLCNWTRSNRFTYEEFLLIGKTIKEIKALRKQDA